MEQKSIEPCPFCRDLNVLITRPVTGKIHKFNELPYQVMCTGCLGRGPMKDDVDEAIEVWNGINDIIEGYEYLSNSAMERSEWD